MNPPLRSIFRRGDSLMLACAALPMAQAVRLGIQVSVLLSVFVAVLAMSARVLREGGGTRSSDAYTNATFQVYRSRDGFQVSRIDATVDAAKVIQIQSCWDWAYEQFICEPMGQLRNCVAIAPNSQTGVISPVNSTEPQPATAGRFRGNQSEQTREDRGGAAHYVTVARSLSFWKQVQRQSGVGI